jgi:hypothetical protein
MKTPEKEQLLNDLLRNEDYAAFRKDLLDHMLDKLRRQRAAGRYYRLLALAACLPIAAVIYLLLAPHTPPVNRPSSAVAVVRTVPLTSGQIVTTHGLITSLPTAQPRMRVVSTTKANISIVTTVSQPMEELTDRQLLALFKDQPIALVTLSPNERRLVFPNEAEQPQ